MSVYHIYLNLQKPRDATKLYIDYFCHLFRNKSGNIKSIWELNLARSHFHPDALILNDQQHGGSYFIKTKCIALGNITCLMGGKRF